MSDADSFAVARAATWFVALLCAYAGGGAILPFLFATGTLRVRAKRDSVRLTGGDAGAMVFLALPMGSLSALLSGWSLQAGMLSGSLALLCWFGCRLTVHVTPHRTRTIRMVAFFIPWSWRTDKEPPFAFTEGWGDILDPLALFLEFEKGARKMEVAWEGKGSPSCDDFATKFNAAVDTLLPLRLGERRGPYR